jgi:predicted metalloprotease with PDZ domain
VSQAATVQAAHHSPVRYEISFPNRVHHEAEIRVTFAGLPPSPLELRMSRSSPGRYALHEFAKNVYAVRAEDGAGKPLALTRPNPHQWDVAGHDGTVRVTYTLFADRADGTYSGIDDTHAHLNMAATFMWARGLAERPITVTFHRPRPDWRIATQLVPTSDSTTFTAPNFQYFMDSPTELSAFTLRSWPVSHGGRTYTIRLALHHAGTEAEADAYAEMARKVVAEQIAVYGEPPAFDHGTYTFIADYLPWVAGDGMEHRNSTVLTGTRPLATGAIGNLRTLSHEFFHAWNIERIRPRSLEPFDFEEANMSGELWFGEGFTSYYDDLILQRAGLTSLDDFASGLEYRLNTVMLAPGRRFFSPIEMSLQAPFVDAAASIDPNNRGNTFISYYTWGEALGLALDLTLRARAPERSLDDFMRAMWERYGATERPYTLDDWRTTLAEVSGDGDFAKSFFDRYIAGRDIADYASLLARAGLRVRPAAAGRAWMGFLSLADDTAGAIVTSSPEIGTPFYAAGVERGDRMRRVDGRAIASGRAFGEYLGTRSPGDSVTLEFEQRGAARRATVAVVENPVVEVVTFERSGEPVTEEIRRFREAWLGSRAPR